MKIFDENGRLAAVAKRFFGCFVLSLVFSSVAPPSAVAGDRYVGYYYPSAQSKEVYGARAEPLPDANRESRIGFIVGFNREMRLRPYPPRFVIFAKGDEADNLIIVGLVDGYLDTIYRVRALLALLTAEGRATKLFSELGVETFFTFLDFAKLFGFKSVTVSDGKQFTHQVTLE
jgi:hypothetical protein